MGEESIRFAVLGAVRVVREGSVLTTGSPQQQALLVALLLRAGRALPAHELLASIWGEDAPESALSSLRTHAWRLRRIVEEDRSAPKVLVSLRDGYQLLVPPRSVDALYAEELAADAARARAAGREADCGRLLAEALALWNGEPLAGVPGPFAEQQRSRLAALRLALMEERFEHDLREGRHALVIPDLIGFTHEHPLQERPYGFLMRALYAMGRQGDALGVFGRARRVLAEELGVDPGPELNALHERILANDPLLMAHVTEGRDPAQGAPEAGAGAGAPAGQEKAAGPSEKAPAATRPAQLPADIPDFTGRESQVLALHRALTDAARPSLALVSVTGMGGIGKSTLALQVAHQAKPEFPGGQLYADLRGNGLEPADPGVVLGSFLTALGVSGQALPASTEDRALLFRTTLDGRRILVLLDNARDPAQIRPLLPGSADCGVIVTSRAMLAGLSTTVRGDLDVFDTGESIALLRAIVGAARVDEEPEDAAELVALCGHLPLAVRIVAARLAARPRWRVATMTARLADERLRIGELRAGDLAVAAVFELGYRQLTRAQARAFRLLAPVTRQGIGTGAAAAALGMDAYDAEQLLEELVDAAMLQAPLPGHYRYHDLVRSFALQLAGSGEAGAAVPGEPGTGECGDDGSAALGRLLDFLLDGARAAFQLMVPGDPVGAILGGSPGTGPRFDTLAQARAWVAEEFDCAVNAAALAARTGPEGDRGTLRAAADLLVALSPFGQDIPYLQLAMTARKVADAAAACRDDQAEARARFVCGNAALQHTRLTEAEMHTRLATEASTRAGDEVVLRQILNDRGLIAQWQRRFSDAAEFYERALEIACRLGHRSGELTTELNAAQARLRSGWPDDALAVCERALERLRGGQDPHVTSYAWYVHGMALHELGRHADAVVSYTACLEVCAAARLRGRETQARFRLSDSLRDLGRHDEALAEAGRALALSEELGSQRERGHCLLALARALAETGDTAAALSRARQARDMFALLGLPDVEQAEELAGLLEEPVAARG
ncbi:regulatory protein AfsR [Streptomyces spiroverticillatus]|uniref:Regulatory protein AfsR n=1 Tax=Streptomyces finlayi TaxID=67296 RepID=A0A919CER4_9ACTN|nr:BTAD domain-containing putative transcriptional regulator [Streptomyces finlayi]GHA42664.1 regulatory protein AfsR [Streptomyces spiroverticillatus]GHD13775.1 regulatory protein AfsR [Streptomyces finlayi]